MQRLILDTSGHGQQGYHNHLDEDGGALPPVKVSGMGRELLPCLGSAMCQHGERHDRCPRWFRSLPAFPRAVL